MNGYVIGNDDGEYLNCSLQWFGYPSIEDAWVHTPEALSAIKESAFQWEHPPTKAWPATLSEEGDVTITGEPIEL